LADPIVTNYYGVNETVWGLPYVCMTHIPSVCTDHDNAVHVLVSLAICTLSTYVAWRVSSSFHEHFENLCVYRINGLTFSEWGVHGQANFMYTKESKEFMRTHPEVRPNGWENI